MALRRRLTPRWLPDPLAAPAGAVAATAAAVLVVAVLVGSGVNLVSTVSIGVQFGAVYALIALGVALVYTSTGVLNFAQGEFGTVPAFLAYVIMVGGVGDLGDIGAVPDASRLWWASLAAVAAGALLGVLVNIAVVQRLGAASPVTALVATAGVALMLIQLQVIVFESQARNFPRYIAGEAFTVARSGVQWHTLLVLGVLAVTATLLAVLFRTRTGTALLATSQEPFAAQLHGVSVSAMSTLAWGTAGALGAVGGLLAGGVFEQVFPALVTRDYLIPAFTGAVLGGITSMVGAVVGGLLLGLLVSFANSLNLALGLNIPGPPQLIVLAALLLVLLVRPHGLLGRAV